MAADMARELRSHNIAVVSIWMGRLDTERARDYFATLPDDFKPRVKRESPQFTGRIISAVYDSDKRMAPSGQGLIRAELALSLGVSEIDGNQPPSYRGNIGSRPEPYRRLNGRYPSQW